MAICVTMQASKGSATGPSSTSLVVSTLETQGITDQSQCPYLLLTSADYAAIQRSSQFFSTCQNLGQCVSGAGASGGGTSNAFTDLGNLSLDNASALSLAILGLWATAWIFKTLRRALPSSDKESE